MGACYSVNLKIKVLERKKAEKALYDHMIHDNKTDYNLKAFSKEEIKTDSLDNLIRINLAGWRRCPYDKSTYEGWTYYSNDFDASYGWESVLIKMFQILAPYLEDESELHIYLDSEDIHFLAQNGKCKVL